MKLGTIIHLWVLVSLISGCKKADDAGTRIGLSNDLPTTGEAAAELARKALGIEQRWIDPIKSDPVTRNSSQMSLFAAHPRRGEIFVSTDPIFEDSQAQIAISRPSVTNCGDLRATVTNSSAKEVQIYPTECGVEIIFRDRVGTLMARDPATVCFAAIKIPPGEAKDFSFGLIPGLMDLTGDLRLFVQAVSSDPLESKIIKSEPFEILELKAEDTTKTGASKIR